MNKIELLAIPDYKTNSMAVCLKPRVPHIITPSLAQEIRKLQNNIAERYYKNAWEGIHYVLWYLHADNLPWNGLDLSYIYEELLNHHEQKVENYVKTVFELLFINYVGYDLPLINCSIVHRPLRGISQDFFYLNQINFIKRYKNLHCIQCNDLPFHQLDFNGSQKTSFPADIYKRNDFYIFDAINLNSMKKVLCSYQHTPISLTQKKQLKLIFDQIMEKTLERIYKLITRKINFEHIALKQSQGQISR